MNVRDSEVICGLLKKAGYRLVDAPEAAEIVLFNTCSVREHAEDKVWSEIGRISKRDIQYSIRNTKLIIGVIGCMAQNYKEQIFERSPNVDFVVGPADIDKIPEIIEKVAGAQAKNNKKATVTKGFKGDNPLFYQRKIWETEGEIRPEDIYHTGFYEDKEHAYVVISEGCSNFCSYCVVPYVRGRLRHRDSEDILREIKEAVEKGINKITLLGQNVNAYNSQVNFIKLLELVNEIEGLKEFSFVTSHPKNISSAFFKAMAKLNKLKKYLHLPVQSGSDRILKLMNRNYTRKYYLELARNYRKIVEGGVLTTDIIIGFPTEKEEDFQDTYNLVKEIGFNAAFIFKYSTRPHTEAAKMADDVVREEKERRHGLVLELQKEISKRNVKSKIKS